MHVWYRCSYYRPNTPLKHTWTRLWQGLGNLRAFEYFCPSLMSPQLGVVLHIWQMQVLTSWNFLESFFLQTFSIYGWLNPQTWNTWMWRVNASNPCGIEQKMKVLSFITASCWTRVLCWVLIRQISGMSQGPAVRGPTNSGAPGKSRWSVPEMPAVLSRGL